MRVDATNRLHADRARTAPGTMPPWVRRCLGCGAALDPVPLDGAGVRRATDESDFTEAGRDATLWIPKKVALAFRGVGV